MEVAMDRKEPEELCVHVVSQANTPQEEENDFRFDIIPFRQTFFRYSLYGLSEVVRSTSFVYASHHLSESAWLDIRKISVALVGSNEIPNLLLFSPTVKEVCFMGHIAYPSVAFKLLSQLNALEKVTFNFGLGGYSNEFHETAEELRSVTPSIPNVTSLEIKVNHRLYNGCTEEMRNVFDKIIISVLKHSSDSFPNLRDISIELPDTPLFFERTISLVNRSDYLRSAFEVDVSKVTRKILVHKKVVLQSQCLSFDPCAQFPSTSQYQLLQRINTRFTRD